MSNEFPAHLFKMGGSPEAIQGGVAEYRQFGQAASAAADRITAMDTSQFIGPEGDQFREKLNSNMPPHLRITGDAFTKVAQALAGFSSQLTDLQGKMRPVAGQAPGVWQRLQAAKSGMAEAKAADQRHETAQQNAQQQHQQAVADAKAHNKPLPPAPTSNYHAATPGAQAELNAAQAEWDALVHKAGGLRTEMSAATDTCCKAINAAKGMRFKEPPGKLDVIGHAQNFIREHKDVLKKISSALKIVSAVVSAIGLALQVIPVVGNAVGAAFLTAGAVMAGAALVIDIGIYAATGEGSLTSIIIDTALTIIPIGAIGRLGKRAFSATKNAAKGVKSTKNAVQTGNVADFAKMQRATNQNNMMQQAYHNAQRGQLHPWSTNDLTQLPIKPGSQGVPPHLAKGNLESPYTDGTVLQRSVDPGSSPLYRIDTRGPADLAQSNGFQPRFPDRTSFEDFSAHVGDGQGDGFVSSTFDAGKASTKMDDLDEAWIYQHHTPGGIDTDATFRWRGETFGHGEAEIVQQSIPMQNIAGAWRRTRTTTVDPQGYHVDGFKFEWHDNPMFDPRAVGMA